MAHLSTSEEYSGVASTSSEAAPIPEASADSDETETQASFRPAPNDIRVTDIEEAEEEEQTKSYLGSLQTVGRLSAAQPVLNDGEDYDLERKQTEEKSTSQSLIDSEHPGPLWNLRRQSSTSSIDIPQPARDMNKSFALPGSKGGRKVSHIEGGGRGSVESNRSVGSMKNGTKTMSLYSESEPRKRSERDIGRHASASLSVDTSKSSLYLNNGEGDVFNITSSPTIQQKNSEGVYSPSRRRSSAFKQRLHSAFSSSSRASAASAVVGGELSREVITSPSSGALGDDAQSMTMNQSMRRNSKGFFSPRGRNSIVDPSRIGASNASRASIASNIAGMPGALADMFSRASMRIRRNDRDSSQRSAASIMSLQQMRLDQARREKMRDQGTDESPYLEDAKRFENNPLELRNEVTMISQLKNICYWSWLGGKSVQDVLADAGLFGSLLDVLQARLADPLYEAPHQESHHGFMSYVGSTFGLNVAVMSAMQKTKISPKGSIAAIRAIATLCRDHLRNQSLAQQSGLVITLVEYIAHPQISHMEKKWAVHALNSAILSNAVAQDMVLGCSRVDDLRSFCSSNFADSDWAVWPNNEVACLMHIFDWKP